MPMDDTEEQEYCESLRQDIIKVQAEYASKAEDLKKTLDEQKEKKDELQRLQDELEKVKDELDLEKRNSSAKESGTKEDLEKTEKSKLLHEKVQAKLGECIPNLQTIQENDEDAVGGDPAGDKAAPQQEPGKKEYVHNHVLVSYSNVGAGTDDFKVLYRIDSTSTIGQFHRDVCSYWGLSHKDYVLCITKSDEAVPLWQEADADIKETMEKRLQSEDVLSPSEKSQIHVVKREQVEKFQAAQKMVKEQEAKLMQTLQGQDKATAEATTIKTLKHGLGYATNEKISEPWVEAFKVWPGLQHMLKNRDRKHDHQKWIRTRLRDFITFGFLIFLTWLNLLLRNDQPFFLLREGVFQTLNKGVDRETQNGQVIAFDEITRLDTYMDWLEGSFGYQIYNESSTLRRFYEPVGILRVRQQMAAQVPCSGRELPLVLRQSCYSVKVLPGQQHTADLSPKNGSALSMFRDFRRDMMTLSGDDPLRYYPPAEPDTYLYGIVQNTYDSGGYSVYIDHQEENLTADEFERRLSFMNGFWISSRTRMIAIEGTFMNRALGGFVSANMLAEVTPAGSVKTVVDIIPFSVRKSGNHVAAEVFDIFRLIIVVIHTGVGLVRGCKTYDVFLQARNAIVYLVSFSGVSDIAMLVLSGSVLYFRAKAFAPDPMTATGFKNYSDYGRNFESLGIVEAVLLIVLVLRFTKMMRFSPMFFHFFKSFTHALHNLAYFVLGILLPIICGASFLATTIWSPYLQVFSSWWESLSATTMATYKPFPELLRMAETGRGWTLPFIGFFWISTVGFTMNAFLAITVQSYFEVELTDTGDASKEKWTRDEYLDWALWPSLYRLVTGEESRSLRKADSDDEADGGSSSSGSSSDEEGK